MIYIFTVLVTIVYFVLFVIMQKYRKQTKELSRELARKELAILQFQVASDSLSYSNEVLNKQIADMKIIHDTAVTQYKATIADLKYQVRLLHNTNPNEAHSFNQEELKVLRYITHPDKNGGKYQNLFIKIDQMHKGK